MIRSTLLHPFAFAFGASAVVHVALALMMVGHASTATVKRAAQAEDRIEIEALTPVAPIENQAAARAAEEPSSSAPRSRALATAHHHHLYPVPADHDAVPHDPRLVHTAGATPDPPVRFTLTLAPRDSTTTGTTTAPSNASSGNGTSGPAAGAGDDRGGEGDPASIFPESGVSVRARLLASRPPIYPPAARQSEIEADVALELIVDTTGRVVSARALTRSGYGLDEAAVRAMEGYRFSPAQRGGRPVRVRMPWTVHFRLQ